MSQFRSDPVPQAPPPIVYPASCLTEGVDPEQLRPEEPPIPPLIERPAGEPNSRNWAQWLAYTDRRREVAELSGLFLEQDRNAYKHAFDLTDEQLDQCVTFIRGVNQ